MISTANTTDPRPKLAAISNSPNTQDRSIISSSKRASSTTICPEWWGHIISFLSPIEQLQLEPVSTLFRNVLHEDKTYADFKRDYLIYKSFVKEGSEFIFRAAISYLNHLSFHELYPKSPDSGLCTWAHYDSKVHIQLPVMRVITDEEAQRLYITFADKDVMLFRRKIATDAFEVSVEALYQPSKMRQAVDSVLEIPYAVDNALQENIRDLVLSSAKYKMLSMARAVISVFKRVNEGISTIIRMATPNISTYKPQSISISKDNGIRPIHDFKDRASLCFAQLCANRAQKLLEKSLMSNTLDSEKTAPIEFSSKGDIWATEQSLRTWNSSRITRLNSERQEAAKRFLKANTLHRFCSILKETKLLSNAKKATQPLREYLDKYREVVDSLTPNPAWIRLNFIQPTDDSTHDEIKQAKIMLKTFTTESLIALDKTVYEIKQQCPFFETNEDLKKCLAGLRYYIENGNEYWLLDDDYDEVTSSLRSMSDTLRQLENESHQGISQPPGD